MSEIVQLYDFRKRRLADTAVSRVIMAIQKMTEAEQRSFIDYWYKRVADGWDNRALVDKLIEEDEAFLAANRRGGRRSEVQS